VDRENGEEDRIGLRDLDPEEVGAGTSIARWQYSG